MGIAMDPDGYYWVVKFTGTVTLVTHSMQSVAQNDIDRAFIQVYFRL
jgi:pterin-4a-carbinolamine dehydratase